MGINLKSFISAFVADKKGGFGTRQRAAGTWRALNQFIEAKHWKNITPETITTKQIRAYIEHRVTDGISPRSVQNEASHIRRACAGVGREIGDVKDPKNNWSSARLGVPEGSRIGGKRAVESERLRQALALVPPDVGAALGLSEALGLRRQEAVMAGGSLDDWGRLLDSAKAVGRGAFLPVGHGTKGGRPRFVTVPVQRLDFVQQAVCQAQAQAKVQCGRVIDSDDLKAALKRVSNACRRAGLEGEDSAHGIRRLFAQTQFTHYLSEGIETRTALAMLSNDLGHGDGRGRWVWNNYLRGGV